MSSYYDTSLLILYSSICLFVLSLFYGLLGYTILFYYVFTIDYSIYYNNDRLLIDYS